MTHGTDASGGGRSAPVTPIKLGFKPEEEEEVIFCYDSHYGIFRKFACVLRANPSKSVAIVDKCCDS